MAETRLADRADTKIISGFHAFSSDVLLWKGSDQGAKIEDVLSKHPAVGVMALIGTPNPNRPGSEIVKAYIQLHPEYGYSGKEDVVKEDIIKFARENCAPYEVPKIIEFVDELPLTSVGKIDKKVLRANRNG